MPRCVRVCVSRNKLWVGVRIGPNSVDRRAQRIHGETGATRDGTVRYSVFLRTLNRFSRPGPCLDTFNVYTRFEQRSIRRYSSACCPKSSVGRTGRDRSIILSRQHQQHLYQYRLTNHDRCNGPLPSSPFPPTNPNHPVFRTTIEHKRHHHPSPQNGSHEI